MTSPPASATSPGSAASCGTRTCSRRTSKDLAGHAAAAKLLRAITLHDLPFTPEAPIEERKKQLNQWQQWWSERSEEFGVPGAKAKR